MARLGSDIKHDGNDHGLLGITIKKIHLAWNEVDALDDRAFFLAHGAIDQGLDPEKHLAGLGKKAGDEPVSLGADHGGRVGLLEGGDAEAGNDALGKQSADDFANGIRAHHMANVQKPRQSDRQGRGPDAGASADDENQRFGAFHDFLPSPVARDEGWMPLFQKINDQLGNLEGGVLPVGNLFPNFMGDLVGLEFRHSDP